MNVEQTRKPDPRVSVRMPARISTIDPETDPLTGERFFRASSETCANVSRGGAFVSMRETIPAGRRLLVELEIPGGKTVQAIGRVVWVQTKMAAGLPAGKAPRSGIGIQFVGGASQDLQALERFVSRTIRRRQIPPDVRPPLASSQQS